MNESQENAIEMYSNELMGALTVKMNSFIPYLEFRGTIIRDERTTIEGMQHDFDKMISLLKLLKQNKNGWKVLHDFLMHNGYPALAQKLQAANTTEATNESGNLQKKDANTVEHRMFLQKD